MKYILYYTQTGNTKVAAEKIKEVMEEAEIYNIDDFDTSKVMEGDTLILGCAAYGVEQLSDEMEEFIDKLEYSWEDRKVGLFGTYGWGDGTWMDQWSEKMEGLGAGTAALKIQEDSIDDIDYKGFADLFKEGA